MKSPSVGGPGSDVPPAKEGEVEYAASYVWPPGDLQNVLDSLLEQLCQLIDCDASAICLLTADALWLAASSGLPEAARVGRQLFSLNRHPERWNLVHDGRPVVFADVAAAGLFGSDVFRELHACIAAPLAYLGRPIGLLFVLQRQADKYSEKDARSVMALANEAAMAIEIARLYHETRRRALQLEVASQVGGKVSAILDMEQMLPEVVRLIRDRFGYDHVHLFLVDGRSNQIVLKECSGEAGDHLKARGVRLKIGIEGITGWVAGEGQPLLCNDVSQEPRYHPDELLPDTRAELAVPLRVGDLVIGVLDVQSRQAGTFRPDDVTTLQMLANQVAIAIENAHLFQRTRRQYEALRALHDVSLEITSQLESQDVLETIMKRAAHLLNAQGSTVAIFDPQQDVIRVVAVYNVPSEYLGATLSPGEGAAGQAIATGQPVVVNDYWHWPRRSSLFRDSPFDAILSVPMRWEERVLGALSVLDRGERRPFTEDDVRLMSLFADLASIALTNAELYDRVRQAGQELEGQVERRTKELAHARQELAHKADQLQRLLEITNRIQEEERTRIARDLHDGSNQLITGTLFEIQAAEQSLRRQRPETAIQKLETAKGLLRTVDAENRRIIAGLRPPLLDAKGLVAALKSHAAAFHDEVQIACTVKVSGRPIRVTPEVETAAYRIVQESLNNVAAHARARNVQIRVEYRPARLRVVVEDDGVGFDYERVLEASPGQMGLIGIRERAQSVGGQIEIQSVPGQGTRLTLEVPLPAGIDRIGN